MVYKWYILPIGGLYATYHLLGEPETTIDTRSHNQDSGYLPTKGRQFRWISPPASHSPPEGHKQNDLEKHPLTTWFFYEIHKFPVGMAGFPKVFHGFFSEILGPQARSNFQLPHRYHPLLKTIAISWHQMVDLQLPKTSVNVPWKD